MEEAFSHRHCVLIKTLGRALFWTEEISSYQVIFAVSCPTILLSYWLWHLSIIKPSQSAKPGSQINNLGLINTSLSFRPACIFTPKFEILSGCCLCLPVRDVVVIRLCWKTAIQLSTDWPWRGQEVYKMPQRQINKACQDWQWLIIWFLTPAAFKGHYPGQRQRKRREVWGRRRGNCIKLEILSTGQHCHILLQHLPL